ncbi:MAG: hypothetical protein PHQ86_01955 [Dehalococcoidales bacterium]|nr:hypothetical protein [Dehalococcoidales bacterium]
MNIIGIILIVIGVILTILRLALQINLSRSRIGGLISGPLLIIVGILITTGVIQT